MLLANAVPAVIREKIRKPALSRGSYPGAYIEVWRNFACDLLQGAILSI